MWSSLRKDLIRFVKDPTAILMGVAIPVVVVMIMKVAFGGGGGGAPTAKLLVADQDESLGSSLLVGALGQGPLEDLLLVEEVAPDAGQDLLREKKASALLTIPPGLGQSLLEDLPDTLHLLTNPSQSILPQLTTGILESLADAVFYLQRLVGDDLRPVVENSGPGGPSADDLSELIPTLGDRAQQIGAMVDNPPLVLVKESMQDEPVSQMSMGEIMLPALLLMGLLFMTQGLSGDLWEEREQGTLRRVVSSNAGLHGWLLGKAAAVFLSSGILALLGFLVARLGFGVGIHNAALAAVWMAWSGAALFALFALIQVLAATRRGGGILSSLVVFPLAMLGGSFFPFEAMPEGLASLGVWTPNGSAILGLRGIMQADLQWPVAHMALVSVVLVVGLAATGWRLSRIVKSGAV